MIDYVKEKYGKTSVRSPFGTMAAKAIRDNGPCHGRMSYNLLRRHLEAGSGKPGMSYTLAYPPEVKKEGDRTTTRSSWSPCCMSVCAQKEDVKTVIEMAQSSKA